MLKTFRQFLALQQQISKHFDRNSQLCLRCSVPSKTTLKEISALLLSKGFSLEKIVERYNQVYKCKGDAEGKYVYIRNDILVIEGCLSVRGYYGEVARPEKVTIEYYDETGAKKKRGASGLFARVLQHEMDHLNGMLFIDRASHVEKIETTG